MIGLCLVVAICCIQVTKAIKPAPLQLTETLRSLQATSDAGNWLLQTAIPVVSGLKATEGSINDLVTHTDRGLNAPCGEHRPCGTLPDVNRTLATLRGTSGRVEAGLLTLDKHSDEVFSQERLTYANMNRAVADLDAVIANPDITVAIANVKQMTGQGTAAMGERRCRDRSSAQVFHLEAVDLVGPAPQPQPLNEDPCRAQEKMQ